MSQDAADFEHLPRSSVGVRAHRLQEGLAAGSAWREGGEGGVVGV